METAMMARTTRRSAFEHDQLDVRCRRLLFRSSHLATQESDLILGLLEETSLTEMAKDFTPYMVKAVISGRTDEVMDLARSNLWR
jgi:hypothetical protein